MNEINKEQFGQFIASVRKQKNMTQKELAGRLFVSDKAVSKWERGLSLPDVTMLMPLAHALDVSVAELLQGKRMEDELPKEEVDKIVKASLQMTQESILVNQKKKKWVYLFLLFICCAEVLFLFVTHLAEIETQAAGRLFLILFLAALFGLYFFVLIKQKLPDYYDRYQVDYVARGFFRMHIPYLYFNNTNWPYIVYAGQLWSGITLIVYPLCYGLLSWLVPQYLYLCFVILIFLNVTALFIGIYAVGKHYA